MIVEMIGLCFRMQGEDIIEHIDGKCDVFSFSMQEEENLGHANAMCQLCTMYSIC
jgi:hypothetical protein